MMLGLYGVQTVWSVVRTDGTVDRWAFGRDDTSSGRLTGNRNLLTFVMSAKYCVFKPLNLHLLDL